MLMVKWWTIKFKKWNCDQRMTVEWIYIAEKSIGIRLENDILVTATGHENLSKSIPIEIKELEQLMKGK